MPYLPNLFQPHIPVSSLEERAKFYRNRVRFLLFTASLIVDAESGFDTGHDGECGAHVGFTEPVG